MPPPLQAVPHVRSLGISVHELWLCPEWLTWCTVKSLVWTLVDVALIVKLLEDFLYTFLYGPHLLCGQNCQYDEFTISQILFTSPEIWSTYSFGEIPAASAFSWIFCPCSSVPVWNIRRIPLLSCIWRLRLQGWSHMCFRYEACLMCTQWLLS